jgi:replicative DNA helicase
VNDISTIQPNTFYVPELEQMVLGSLLLDGDLLPQVQGQGGADLFHDEAHRALYEKIRANLSANVSAGPVTLANWAEMQEGIKALGGAQYVTRIAASSSMAGFSSYLDSLSDMMTRRTLSDRLRSALSDLSGDMPVDTVAGTLEAALQSTTDTPRARRPVSMMAAATKALSEAMAVRSGEKPAGVQTGFHRADSILGGMYPGDLVLLGGRPSMGKTAVAMSIALNAARAGRKVAIFSLEMNPEALAVRAISEATSQMGRAVAYTSIRQGQYNDIQAPIVANATKEVANLPIMFLDRQYQDVGAVLAGTKQAARIMDGIDLLIVDYAQLLRAPNTRSRYEEITEISRALKGAATTLGIPVLALSQLSRALEQRDNKRPMMSDLRESGQLEQDADSVMFCFREEYYLEREEPDPAKAEKYEAWERAMEAQRGRLELIIAKQRQGGIGTAHLRCALPFNRVWED